MDKIYRKYMKDPKKFIAKYGADANGSDGTNSNGDVITNHAPKLVRGASARMSFAAQSELSQEDTVYMLAVERGDVPKVRHYLEAVREGKMNININCVDPLGRTALLIVIEHDNIDLLHLLLTAGVEVGDALLHAISEENVEAVRLIIEYVHTTGHSKKDLSSLLGGRPSNAFTNDITPLKLAAQRDNFEIVKMLLDHGETITHPHDVQCSCSTCVAANSENSLQHSLSRLNAYRALASPSYIVLTSDDPFLTCFELSWELGRLKYLENEFRVEYSKLADQCQDIAVGLLDQVRGSDELEMILNYDPDNAIMTDDSDDGGGRMRLNRLKLAVKYKLKKFVAHANCQQLLASVWYEGLPGFRRRPEAFKAMLTTAVFLLSPILSIIYIVAPFSRIGSFMRRPFIKFITHVASYVIFLCLLVLAALRVDTPVSLWGYQTTRDHRGAPPTLLEWMIIGYVITLIWAECKNLWVLGLMEYITNMWHFIDFATSALYVAAFTTKMVAFLIVQQQLAAGNPAANESRDLWDSWDPNLISEAAFAGGNVLSMLKLVDLFTINPHLGPLKITIGRILIDIGKFAFFVVLVVISFGCGFNQLYWYYAEVKVVKCAECKANCTDIIAPDSCGCDCDRSIANLFEILQTIYFACFGLISVDTFAIDQPHYVTQFIGKLMFGCYLACNMLVLINMLIAMLTESLRIISENADIEWKYARSKLWISYFEDGGTVPPPFNVIPTPKSTFRALTWVKDKLCCNASKNKLDKWHHLMKILAKVKENEQKYRAVIQSLVRRYVSKKAQDSMESGVTEDDLNEIKQDIASFRYELVEILRNNGMLIPSMTSIASAKTKKIMRKYGRLRNALSQPNMQEVKDDLADPTSTQPISADQLNSTLFEDDELVTDDDGMGDSSGYSAVDMGHQFISESSDPPADCAGSAGETRPVSGRGHLERGNRLTESDMEELQLQEGTPASSRKGRIRESSFSNIPADGDGKVNEAFDVGETTGNVYPEQSTPSSGKRVSFHNKSSSAATNSTTMDSTQTLAYERPSRRRSRRRYFY